MTDVSDARIAAHRPTVARVEAAIRAVLPSSVALRLISSHGPDVELAVNEEHITARWVKEGWLRAIRDVLDHDPLPTVVVARQMGPASRLALSEAGVGWVDETGAAEVITGALVVSRTGHSQTTRKPRWTRSVLAVAEAVLWGSKATVSAIAEATGLSTGTCTNALRTLTDLGFLGATSSRGRGSGRHVIDGDGLLAAYVEQADALARPVSLQLAVTWQDAVDGLVDLGITWDELGTEWVASGQVAAAVVAPLVSSVRSAIVYVAADTLTKLEALAHRSGLRPIEGGRLTLAPFPSATTLSLAAKMDGLRVAPWPRIYADLLKTGVRGEEAAEHLREVVGG